MMINYVLLILLPLALLNIWWGYANFKQQKPFSLILSGMISIGLSVQFPLAIGTLLFATGIVKMYIGFINGFSFQKQKH